MPKFTDPNYNTLKTYFDILVSPRSGNANSYIVSQKGVIVATGGISSPLYQLKDNGDFVGYNFIINEIRGDDFIFTYDGMHSRHSEATRLEVGKEMYFRKNSFFRNWLDNNADVYGNFVNRHKSFIYFGKIYELSGYVGRYYIKFEGLKNWVLECLPQHNRTERITEFVNVAFDQVYHEPYNMLKNMWSFFDPKEIDFKHLYYLADRYGIVLDNSLEESVLREWVDQLMFLLKRKSTYTSYFIIYKLLFSNTNNKLNIYERWLEKCHPRIFGDTTPAGYFEDHHILEHYGVHPSGGAGDIWYQPYDPDDYPVFSDIDPWEDVTYTCNNEYLSLATSSFSTYDDSNRIVLQDDNSVIVHAFEPDHDTLYLSKQFFSRSVAHGGFRYCFRFLVSSGTTVGGYMFVWAIANTGNNLFTSLDDPIGLYVNVSLAGTLKVGFNNDGATDYLLTPNGTTDATLEYNTWYHVTIESYSNLDFGPDEDTRVIANIFTSANKLPSEKIATGDITYDGLSRDYLLMYTHTREASWVTFYIHIAYLSYLINSDVCSQKAITCTNPLDLTTFIGEDTGSNITTLEEDLIEVDNFNPNTSTMYLYKSFTTLGRIFGGFKHSFTFYIPTSNTGNGRIYLWMQATQPDVKFDNASSAYGFYIDGFLTLKCGLSSPSTSKTISTDIREGVYYYATIYTEDMDADYIAIDIYNAPTRRTSEKIISGNIQHDGASRNYLYVLNQGGSLTGSHDLQISDYYTGATEVETIAASGNLFLSPHYKVEIDLSTEPMYVNHYTNCIITEYYAKEIIRYWEYLKPVSKFLDYHFVLAPLARIDDFNEYVSLYNESGSAGGYCLTKFTGSFFTEQGEGGGEVNPDFNEKIYVYRQAINKTEWKIDHNLNASDVIVQVYDEYNQIVYMDNITIIDANSLTLTFESAIRGSAFIAALKDWNYLHTTSVAADPWTINHNLGDEGAQSFVFDIYNLSRNDYLIPDKVQIINTNQMVVTWSTTDKAVTATGRIPIRDEDYIHTQAVASTVWTINHNLNAAGFIVEVWDSSGEYVFPASITHTTFNRTTITFTEATAGHATLVYCQREFDSEEVVNSMFDGGYWMIGDEDSDTFEPEIANRLNSPTASGSLLEEDITEYADKYIVNFTVPKGQEYSIRELGIFNSEGNIMFYTKCSELFKPEEVQLDIHYRISKE